MSRFPSPFVYVLERRALALFAAFHHRVSSSGDGGVALALQVVGDVIREDLRGSGVVLVGEIASYGVAIDGGRGGIVLDGEISASGVARAAASGTHLNRVRTALEAEVAFYDGAADRIRSRTRAKRLNLQVPADACSHRW